LIYEVGHGHSKSFYETHITLFSFHKGCAAIKTDNLAVSLAISNRWTYRCAIETAAHLKGERRDFLKPRIANNHNDGVSVGIASIISPSLSALCHPTEADTNFTSKRYGVMTSRDHQIALRAPIPNSIIFSDPAPLSASDSLECDISDAIAASSGDTGASYRMLAWEVHHSPTDVFSAYHALMESGTAPRGH
jgi:hypothetical protein